MFSCTHDYIHCTLVAIGLEHTALENLDIFVWLRYIMAETDGKPQEQSIQYTVDSRCTLECTNVLFFPALLSFSALARNSKVFTYVTLNMNVIKSFSFQL